ncbi:outer membrane protein assembly factor BamE [Actibacterium sp. D379-3]
MQNARGIRKLALAGALTLALVGCTSIYQRHGFAPTQGELDNIIIGVDTRDTVGETVGPPSVSSLVQEDAWYYVESVRKTRGPLAPEEVSRNLVAISFDPAGTVRNIEVLGLEDGRVVTLNRRVSDDNLKGISFLRQLLGNVGNFSAEQILNEQ